MFKMKFTAIIITLFLILGCSKAKGNNNALKSEVKAKEQSTQAYKRYKNRVYSIVANLNVRKSASLKSPVITKIRNNFRFDVVKRGREWTQIRLNTGKKGYVYNKYITDLWIKVLKSERVIQLMKNKRVVKQYPIGLGFNPVDDKFKYGDGSTANGRFYVCEMLPNPKPRQRYGARSLRLSYPNIEDARRGLKAKLINKKQYISIVKAIFNGKTPLQNTRLGGSLRIHGGGAGEDWTLGCMAMNNNEIMNLFSKLTKKNIMAEVYMNELQYQRLNDPLYANKVLLRGAKRLFKDRLEYTVSATKIIKMAYPMGDFNRKIGVCTDVVIRGLREVNIDLQALLYEDIIMNPSRYNIKRPNSNIDHRRVKNLKHWLDTYAITLSNKSPGNNSDWEAGDIVLFDTGVKNGTIYDHIGIVSNRKVKGRPSVINLWTVGYKLNEMDLLNGDYPKIVGHYRLRHIFDYTVVPNN